MKTKMNVKRLLAVSLAAMMTATAFAGCGNSGGSSSDSKADSASTGTPMTNEEIIKKAAAEGKIGNWGLGNEYEILALLQKYDLPGNLLHLEIIERAYVNDTDNITHILNALREDGFLSKWMISVPESLRFPWLLKCLSIF